MLRPAIVFATTALVIVGLLSSLLYFRTERVLAGHGPGDEVAVSSDVCHALRWTGRIDAATRCPARMTTVVRLLDASRD